MYVHCSNTARFCYKWNIYILGCSDLDLFVKMEDTKAEMDAKFEFKTYLKKIFFLSE